MPGRVDGSSRVVSRAPAALGRTAALKELFTVAEKALKVRKPKTASLELATSDLYTGKGGVKAVVVSFDREKDARRTGRSSLPVETAYIDEAKKQLYLPHWSGTVGPLPLPAGVTLRALLDPGAPPKAKNAYQKTIAALSEAVLDGLPKALREERTQLKFSGGFVAPSGERMQHAYIDDHTGRIPGGALMVGKKEFWVEMIPGVSGECLGPFALPKGFSMRSLEKPEPAAPRRGGTVDIDRGRGTSGYDSSRGFPDSLGRIGAGGSSSGVVPMRGSVWGSGSSGGGGGGGGWGGGGGGS